MLNPKTNERELVYVVTIDDIKPIEGRDRVECAVVGGWTIMVRKDQFKPGDLVSTSRLTLKYLQRRLLCSLRASILRLKHKSIRLQMVNSGHRVC